MDKRLTKIRITLLIMCFGILIPWTVSIRYLDGTERMLMYVFGILLIIVYAVLTTWINDSFERFRKGESLSNIVDKRDIVSGILLIIMLIFCVFLIIDLRDVTRYKGTSVKLQFIDDKDLYLKDQNSNKCYQLIADGDMTKQITEVPCESLVGKTIILLAKEIDISVEQGAKSGTN